MTQTDSSQYLGKEKITKLMLKFSIPCILSLLVSSLYNIVDQIFIGNSELSTLGNAATGIVFPIFIIAQAFAWCFGDGCAAYLNICQGRKDSQNAHKAIGTGMTLTLIASLAIMAVFYPLKTPVLTLFGASENSLGYAIDYFDVVLAFLPLFMLSNMMNGVIRADGSPTWSMLSMLAGAIVNIILDPVFIFAAKWGMFGAALATAIGQTASFVVSLVYFFRTKTFKLTLKSFIPNLKAFKGAFQLGVSSFITQITIVALAIICNVMLAKYGAQSKYGADIPIAVISIQSKVFTVVINLVVGIVLGCQPIISYNMGAKKHGRVKELYYKILLCTVIIGAVSTLVFELFPHAVAAMFGTPSNIPNPADYWEFAEKTFRIFLCLIIFTCIVKMTSIFFQAAGMPIRAVLASLVRDIACFIPLTIILPIVFGGVEGILYASPVSDVLAMAINVGLTIPFLRSLNKKLKSESAETAQTVLQPSKPGVIITIAREHGSAGKQIGKLLAEKLKIPFYYKEMTALAAQESGLDREFVSKLNESAPTALYNLYLSTNVVQQAVVAQDKIIRKIADSGSCVIVGRAADYVLRDHENVVRIFLYAPEEYKVRRIMELYGDNEAEAVKHVRSADAKRASYYHSVSERVWGDRGNYDLMLDTSIGIEGSVESIYTFLQSKNEPMAQE